MERSKVALDELSQCLLSLVEHDADYDGRYSLVIQAMFYASRVGYEVGIRLDPDEPQWPVVYIELPTGQVSWHMPEHSRAWDGHNTEEKFYRIQSFALADCPTAKEMRGMENGAEQG